MCDLRCYCCCGFFSSSLFFDVYFPFFFSLNIFLHRIFHYEMLRGAVRRSCDFLLVRKQPQKAHSHMNRWTHWHLSFMFSFINFLSFFLFPLVRTCAYFLFVANFSCRSHHRLVSLVALCDFAESMFRSSSKKTFQQFSMFAHIQITLIGSDIHVCIHRAFVTILAFRWCTFLQNQQQIAHTQIVLHCFKENGFHKHDLIEWNPWIQLITHQNMH